MTHRLTDEGFELTFDGLTEGRKQHRVTLLMALSWLEYLPPQLYEIVAEKQKRLTAAVNALKGH